MDGYVNDMISFYIVPDDPHEDMRFLGEGGGGGDYVISHIASESSS